MKIVFATSEMVPFAKTGGLADVCGSLPHELALLGHEVKVFLPRYRKVDPKKFSLRRVVDTFVVPLGQSIVSGSVLATTHKNVEVFFIENPEFYDRDELYGTPQGDYPDNDRRFTFFQRAVLEVLKVVGFKPDVLHCHDWQSGLIPVYLKTLYKDDPFFKKTKSIFTIHNLAYQGTFPPDSLSVTGLSWEEYTMHRLEFWGKMNFLKGGLVYSDAITTVSERYAQEIQTAEYGCGLEGVLQERKEALCGIINGLDPVEWNPETDPDLAARYSVSDVEKKVANKTALQKEHGLALKPTIPVFGMVTRLADQKGLDILAPIIEEMAQMDVQFVLLGTGEEKYHQLFRKIHDRFPKKFGINIKFDAGLAKRIYGGSDLFLMPSRFEPCGLGQLISLRYGTVPLVRSTGGLADTIENFDEKTGKGNGFSFTEYSSKALLDTIRRATAVFADKKSWWMLVKNGMKCDFSWKHSAQQYVALFGRVEKKVLKT